MIDGFNAAPLISLPAFIIGFMIALLIIRWIAEYIVRNNKSPQELGRVPASVNKSVQRYYNRKGA